VLAASPAAADTSTTPMPWEDCLAKKADMQARFDIKADRVIEIVNSTALAVTRLCTSEGAVSISCSKFCSSNWSVAKAVKLGTSCLPSRRT
jgi:hypothetical protein